MLRRPPASLLTLMPQPSPVRPPAQPRDSVLYTGYLVAVITAAAAVLVISLPQFVRATVIPSFWLMAVLAVLADAQTVITRGRKGSSIIVCPSLCFTFAVLLCWDLGPAIVVQSIAVLTVALRMRSPIWRALLIAAQYTISF